MDSSETPRADGASGSLEDQSSQAQTAQQNTRVRAKSDPAWAYGLEMEVVEDGKKKKWIKCLLCNEVLKGGGIHRLKLHLAGITGSVKGCRNVTAEVRYEMQQSMETFAGKRRKSEEVSARARGDADGDDCVEVSPEQVAANTRVARAKKGKAAGASRSATTNRAADRFFLPRGQPGDQQTIKSVLQSKEAVERVDLLINKWFLDASIAFNATTSKYYQPMIDAIAGIGSGYQGPSMYRMRGPLLAKNGSCWKEIRG